MPTQCGIKQSRLEWTALLLLCLIGYACENKDVKQVKNGTLPGYGTATIGNAFEASFGHSKWKSVKGPHGEKFVEFTGKINKTLHKEALKLVEKEAGNIGLNDQTASLFQWALGELGGDESEFFKDLNKKYNCELESMMLNMSRWFYFPSCSDKSHQSDESSPSEKKYMKEAVDAFEEEYWKVGEPVKVTFIITHSALGDAIQISEFVCKECGEGTGILSIINLIYGQ